LITPRPATAFAIQASWGTDDLRRDPCYGVGNGTGEVIGR